jgi:hypothetical protein
LNIFIFLLKPVCRAVILDEITASFDLKQNLARIYDPPKDDLHWLVQFLPGSHIRGKAPVQLGGELGHQRFLAPCQLSQGDHCLSERMILRLGQATSPSNSVELILPSRD